MSRRVKKFIIISIVLVVVIGFLTAVSSFSNKQLSFHITRSEGAEGGIYEKPGYYLEFESQKEFYGDCLSHFGTLRKEGNLIILDIDAIKTISEIDKNPLDPDLMCGSLFDGPQRARTVTTLIYLGELERSYNLIISFGSSGFYKDKYLVDFDKYSTKVKLESKFLNFSKCKNTAITECI